MSDGMGTAGGMIALHISDALASAQSQFPMVSISVDPDDFDYDGFARQFMVRATERQKCLVDACEREGEERCSADPLTTILWRVSQLPEWQAHRRPIVAELQALERQMGLRR